MNVIVPAVILASVCGGWFAAIACAAIARRTGFFAAANPLVESHKQPTAYLGGLAVLIGLCAGIAVAIAISRTNNSLFDAIHSYWPGAVAFLLFGLFDDRYPLRPLAKLATQIVIAFVVVILGTAAFARAPVFGIIAAFWIVIVVNAVNLTDVSDGLVCGLAATACAILAALVPNDATLLLSAAGGCAGVLVLNRPPARIFLGDAGAHLLGFIIALAQIRLVATHSHDVNEYFQFSLVAVLIVAVFLFELYSIVYIRHKKGLPFWRGSPDHFALRLQRVGLSRNLINGLAWGCAALCAALAWIASQLALPGAVVVTLAIFGMAWLMFAVMDQLDPYTPAGQQPPPLERVLWMHQNFVSARQGGSSRAMHTISALLESGQKIDIICGNETPVGTHGQAAGIEKDGGLTIHRLDVRAGFASHTGKVGSHLKFAKMAALYSRRLERPSMVFCSSPPLAQVVAAVAVAVFHRCPLVMEVRDLWPSILADARMVRKPWLYGADFVEALSYRSASHVIAVTSSTRCYLRTFGVDAARTSATYTGGDVDRSSVASDDVIAPSGPAASHAVIYTGSFNEAYDIPLLIDAARLARSVMPDVMWIFAGAGRQQMFIEQAATDNSNVKYLGALTRDELRVHLDKATVGLAPHASWPMLSTCVSGKLFDYMSAGLPVLVIRGGEMGLIARDAGAGVVLTDATAESVVDAVRRMIADPLACAQMGVAGKEWIALHGSAHAAGRHVAELLVRINDAPTVRHGFGSMSACVFLATVDTIRRRRLIAERFILSAAGAAATAAAFADWKNTHTAESEIPSGCIVSRHFTQ